METARGRRNNVAFVRGRNSGHIEHPTVTRWECPDEQRAGKEGDERERGNKRGGGRDSARLNHLTVRAAAEAQA